MNTKTWILFIFLFFIGATMAESAPSYMWVRPFGGTILTGGNGSCTCLATYNTINETQRADNITLTVKIDALGPSGTAYDTINITQRADNITLTSKDAIFERNNASVASVLNVIRSTITANNNSIFDEIGTFELNNISIAAVMATMRTTQIADNITLTNKINLLPPSTAYDSINVTQRADNITLTAKISTITPIMNCSVSGSCPAVAYDNNYPNTAINTTNLTINNCIFDKNTIAKICFVNGVVVISG